MARRRKSEIFHFLEFLVPFDFIDDWNAVASTYADECISESGADSETARKMFENHKLVNEEHIRCYFKCLSMKNKFMSEDGVYDAKALEKGLQHVTPEIAQNCLSKYGNALDLCRRAYLVATCITEENY
ncbi:hypothetical protein RN001_007557, partial [Aquatica leii]